MRLPIFIILFSVIPSYSLIVIKSYSPSVPAQDLQFYREDIVFTLNNHKMETNAVYRFCNVGEKDIITPLLYPFPENTMELIDSIVVMNDNTSETVPFRKVKSSIMFQISVKAYGQASYRVFFRQKLIENKFTYILTSTESWHRALEFANFELEVPDRITIDSLSYLPDSVDYHGDSRHYYWEKKDFLPMMDFEVVFH